LLGIPVLDHVIVGDNNHVPGDGIENGDLVLAAQDADSGGSLEIVENALGHYEVRRRAGLGSAGKLAEYSDLDSALAATDSTIRERYSRPPRPLSKRARRREQPATEKQLRFLEVLGEPIPGIGKGRLCSRGARRSF